MAELILDAATIEIGGTPVLADLDATVVDGDFVAVVGPSGCGKSTLLRAVGGLIGLSHGRLWFDGADVTDRRPGDRDIGMVFQSPTLLPGRNVRSNVAFPLELRRETVEAIRSRVDAEARAMRIEHLLLRRPGELSRGEEQLVQIARAMVRAPRVLLLDEPFAPLDEHLRRRMRAEIRVLQDGYGVTTLMATNDPDDVAALATSVIVLGGGDPAAGRPSRILQAGPIGNVIATPDTVAVAEAMGPLWTVPVDVEADGRGFWLNSAGGAVRIRVWTPGLRSYVGRTITFGVRSHDLSPSEDGEISAVLDRVVPGASRSLMCTVAGHRVVAMGEPEARLGSSIRLAVDTFVLFDAATGERIS